MHEISNNVVCATSEASDQPALMQRLCLWLEYSMIIKLLTEHHFEFLSLKKPAELIWPYHCYILWFDTADLSDHGPIIALQVRLGQWQSFTGMEHGPPHARAVYLATGLVREVVGWRTGSSSHNFFQAVFTWVVTVISQPPPAESMSPR